MKRVLMAAFCLALFATAGVFFGGIVTGCASSPRDEEAASSALLESTTNPETGIHTGSPIGGPTAPIATESASETVVPTTNSLPPLASPSPTPKPAKRRR